MEWWNGGYGFEGGGYLVYLGAIWKVMYKDNPRPRIVPSEKVTIRLPSVLRMELQTKIETPCFCLFFRGW